MKNLLCCGAIAITCLTPVATLAAPVVRTIKQTQASGTTATLQTINIWSGHGVVISFYEVKETVKRVWLDDPSQILLDTDGCLERLDQNCQSPGAGLIHLKRISKVNLTGLPQTPTTLLTIITQTPGGDRKVYSFRVAVSNGRPKYNQVVITPDVPVQKKAPIPQLKPISENIEIANKIRNGVAIAIRNKTLNPGDELHRRLQQLIKYVQQGDDLPIAANKAVISTELANKLIEMGK